MKRLLFVPLVFLCASAAFADPATEARQAIEAIYAKVDAATMAADPTIFKRICTPDCRFVQPGQPPQTVEQITKEIAPVMAQWRGMKTQTVVDAVTVSGAEAVVTDTQTTDGVFNGQPLHDVTQNKDTWKKTPGGWRLALSLVVSDKMTPGTLPPTDPALAQAVLAQIKEIAAPLATTDPTGGLGDLAPVGVAVGDARLVALGEASHGTREFFQMKHRLLEYLVTQKGFTVFAMEANWPETEAVDRYIKTGQGDPKAALAGLYFWTWNTQEVLDLIEWMRAYNAAPGVHPTLSFTGFDMQTPDVALARVEAYLRQVAPAEVPALRKSYAPLRALMARQASRRTTFPAPPSPAVAASCRAGAAAVLARMDARREAYVQASSAGAFGDARQNALIVAQATEEMTVTFQEGGEGRNRAMAANIRWLTDWKYPGQKMVLWAHNGHVGAFEAGGHKSMGAYLRSSYGPALAVLGFAFDRGEIRAVPMAGGQMKGRAVPLPVPPAGEGTGDALLHQAGLPRFLLDFHRVAPDSPLGAWLASPHPFQMPGAAWDPAEAALFAQPVTLRTAYDGLIYIDESHASRELPFPKRTAKP